MNTHTLKAAISLSLRAWIGFGFAAAAFGAAAATDPVGYNSLSLVANSDTVVSLPFYRASAYVGQVASVSGNVITLAGSPGWTGNQFVRAAGAQPNTYYVFVRTGAKEGNYYTVTANGTATVTVDLGGDTLAGLIAGDSLNVIPYWTLSTMFPAGDAGVSFDVSASALVRKTEIFLMDLDAVGTNVYTNASFYFFNGAWRKFGRPVTESHDDTTLNPDEFFILRNNTANARTLTASGNVFTSKFASVLRTLQTGKQDSVVALARPIPVTLDEMALITSGAFQTSTSAVVRKDELQVFDNSVVQKGRTVSAVYFHYNGGWRKFGQPLTTDFGSTVVAPGTGFIVRKAASVAGASQVWVNPPTY